MEYRIEYAGASYPVTVHSREALLEHLKKPTLAQKKTIRAAGLDWKNWSVAADYGSTLHIVSKCSGQRRIIHK